MTEIQEVEKMRKDNISIFCLFKSIFGASLQF